MPRCYKQKTFTKLGPKLTQDAYPSALNKKKFLTFLLVLTGV